MPKLHEHDGVSPADLLTYDGTTQPVSEWALDYGIPAGQIIQRLQQGQSVEAAITTMMSSGTPKRGRRAQTHYHDGVSLTLREWSELSGTPYRLIVDRIRRGYPIGVAIGNSYGRKGHNPPDYQPATPSTITARHPNARLHTFNGMTMTVAEWASHLGIKHSALRTRIARRGSLAEALCMPKGTYRGQGANFDPSEGTGGGSTAQESAQIDFPSEVP